MTESVSYPTETFTSRLLGESYQKIRHPSGLDIYLFPKDMTTTYALFGTRYGSTTAFVSATENVSPCRTESLIFWSTSCF